MSLSNGSGGTSALVTRWRRWFAFAGALSVAFVACGRAAERGSGSDAQGTGAVTATGGQDAERGAAGAPGNVEQHLAGAPCAGFDVDGSGLAGSGTLASSAGGEGGAASNGVGGAGGKSPNAETNQAVAYRVDSAHSGKQLAQKIEPPLRRLWTKTFSFDVSYPLIVGERVFASALGARTHP